MNLILRLEYNSLRLVFGDLRIKLCCAKDIFPSVPLPPSPPSTPVKALTVLKVLC